MTGAFIYLSILLLFNLCHSGETERGEKGQGEDRGWHKVHQKMCERASETIPEETILEPIWIKG